MLSEFRILVLDLSLEPLPGFVVHFLEDFPMNLLLRVSLLVLLNAIDLQRRRLDTFNFLRIFALELLRDPLFDWQGFCRQ